jgi:anti-anti-sigma factor
MRMARFQTFETDGVAVLAVEGEFDLGGVDGFLEARELALQRDLPLVIDLGACEFIDSSGIGCLLRTFQLSQQLGRRFALVGSGRQVRHVLEFVGVPERVPYVHRREDAIALVTEPTD